MSISIIDQNAAPGKRLTISKAYSRFYIPLRKPRELRAATPSCQTVATCYCNGEI